MISLLSNTPVAPSTRCSSSALGMANLSRRLSKTDASDLSQSNLKAKSLQADLIIRAIKIQHFKTYKRLDPTEVLITLLKFKQCKTSTYDYRELSSKFFQEPSSKENNSYDLHIVEAIRTGDIDLLKECREEGESMTARNSVHESLLHLACRRGQTDIVRFLVNDARVPVRVCDEYGRNVLHDAFWTVTPNFELVDIIVEKCPDLLFIRDARGHTPLNYAPRGHWKLWLKHFAKNVDSLKPSLLPNP